MAVMTQLSTMKIPTEAALLKQSEKGSVERNLQNNNNKNVLVSGVVDSDLQSGSQSR